MQHIKSIKSLHIFPTNFLRSSLLVQSGLFFEPLKVYSFHKTLIWTRAISVKEDRQQKQVCANKLAGVEVTSDIC